MKIAHYIDFWHIIIFQNHNVTLQFSFLQLQILSLFHSAKHWFLSILELPVVLISTMAGAYQYVFAIIIEKENWTIKVKVIRLWYFPSFSGSKAPFSLEMVLMDEEVCGLIFFTSFYSNKNLHLIIIFLTMLFSFLFQGGKVRASVGKTLTYNLKVF